MLVVAIDGSPKGAGKTATALRGVLAGAEAAGATSELVTLAEQSPDDAIDVIDAAEAVVFGSPVYRASYVYELKRLLDELPRGMWGEARAPIHGKAVAIVTTSASLHHFLALDGLRSVLAGFFAAHIVPPGLHVSRENFDAEGQLDTVTAELAARQGAALVELAHALPHCPVLRSVTPQA
jgi:FMN reductase